MPLLVLSVVVLAGWALVSGGGIEFPGKNKDVLGISTEVSTHQVSAKRSHNLFGLTVNTPVTNIVSDDTGEVLEIKPSVSDWIADLLE